MTRSKETYHGSSLAAGLDGARQVVRADGSPGEAGAGYSRRAARGLGFYFCNLTGAVDITAIRALGIYFPFLRPGGGAVFHVDRAET